MTLSDGVEPGEITHHAQLRRLTWRGRRLSHKEDWSCGGRAVYRVKQSTVHQLLDEPLAFRLFILAETVG